MQGSLAPTTPLVVAHDESSWLARIRAGETPAFESLFHAYYSPLWAYALGFLNAPDVAEECVQDVLFRLWAQREQLVVRETVRGYLYAAVRNEALNVLKRQRVVAQWAERAGGDLSISGAGTGPVRADEQVMAAERASALADAIAALPPRRREAVVLRWQHGLSNAQVASVMGVSVKAVEAHHSVAFRTLRETLRPYSE